jgi:hypothetical protein
MQPADHHPARQRTAAHAYDTSLFVALELSRLNWILAFNTPGSDRVSKHQVPAADTAALLSLLNRLKVRAER